MKTKQPLQVYLEQRQDQALRALAAREKTTLSELIRRSVDLLLSQLPPESDPAHAIIALGASRQGDLAGQHDRYLAEEIVP